MTFRLCVERGNVVRPTLWKRQPHTLVKHEIYDKYVDAWLPIMLSRRPVVTYAEGFSGPGVYVDGEPGSPIRALHRLRAAWNLRPDLRKRLVRLVLVEKRADRVERLLEEFRRELNDPMPRCEYRDESIHVVIRKGRCEETLPEALSYVRAWDAPILAVLDSFGGGSTQRLVRRFAETNGGEVLVTVEPQHFVRNLDPVRAGEVFGGSDWQAVNILPPQRKRTFIARELEKAVRAASFKHVITFGLESDDGGELLLQFGTNHNRGLEKFKDGLWQADPIGGAKYRDPQDPNQMLLEIGIGDPNLAPLRRMLLAHLDAQPRHTATVQQLCDFALEHTIYRAPHVRPALARLLAERSVAVGNLRPDATSTQIRAGMDVIATGSEPLFGLDGLC